MHIAVSAVLGIALLSATATEAVELDRPTQALIDHVNRHVNRAYAPLAPFADPSGDGVWDCENYAAEKMARLVAAGLPVADLTLWQATTGGGRSHAVLVIRASRRGRAVELVLDNLSEWTVAKQRLQYSGWTPLALDWRETSDTGRRAGASHRGAEGGAGR